jgi:hypothetical protein
MQRLPVVNTGTPVDPEAESGADPAPPPPPHDPPPPVEAAEPPDKDPPEQIQGPAIEGALLESLRGKASQRAMWHIGQSQAWAPKGKEPHRMAHGCPPDLRDPKSRGSVILEPAVVIPKAPVHADQA